MVVFSNFVRAVGNLLVYEEERGYLTNNYPEIL